MGRRFDLDAPVDLRLTLLPLRRGGGDPATRFLDDGTVWRATRTPEGPATTRLRANGRTVHVEAWGPGAEWALEAAPALAGADDDPGSFRPEHPALRDLHRRLAGMRICRSQAVVEAMVPTILEQKVQGMEARRSYRRLVRQLGEPAPGPVDELDLKLPPAPDVLASTPSWTWHRLDVERKRADAIALACRCAAQLEQTVSMDRAEASSRLSALPGVGRWTAAEVAVTALGDADAVSLGDFHLPNQVSWLLAGEPRGDDARMLELLEPYRGHRGRVLRLLAAGGVFPPRFGPRTARRSIAAL